jgi:hypothetical protein
VILQCPWSSQILVETGIQLVNGSDRFVEDTTTNGSPGYPFVTFQTRLVPDKDTQGGVELVCETPGMVDDKSNDISAITLPVLVRKALAIPFISFG